MINKQVLTEIIYIIKNDIIEQAKEGDNVSIILKKLHFMLKVVDKLPIPVVFTLTR